MISKGTPLETYEVVLVEVTTDQSRLPMFYQLMSELFVDCKTRDTPSIVEGKAISDYRRMHEESSLQS